MLVARERTRPAMAEEPMWAEGLLHSALASMTLSCGICCCQEQDREVVIDKVKAFPASPGIPSGMPVFKPEHTEEAEGEEGADDRFSPQKQEFMVIVSKRAPGALIGLDTVARSSPSDGCALRVQKVKEGLVQDWNIANFDMQVREGDHICEVNGEKSDTEKMYTVIAVSSDLNLYIRRIWPPTRLSEQQWDDYNINIGAPL